MLSTFTTKKEGAFRTTFATGVVISVNYLITTDVNKPLGL